MASKLFITLTLVAVCISLGWGEEESETAESKPKLEKPSEEKLLKYTKPEVSGFAYIAEPFHSKSDFDNVWILSQAKKDGVDVAIAKYDGNWAIEEPTDNPMKGDTGLVLKTRAKHYAVSTMLPTKFEFKDRPLMLQYEVKFQVPMECGGAYVKLLSEDPKLDLEDFTDKSGYTIMFGPDKCGEDSKMHFIFRHKNAISGNYEEKHAKKPTGEFSKIFDDKKTHLVTLIVKPENTFEILVDKKSVNSGSLLSDFTPPVNPPKEIDDPNDTKPENWDDKEKIPDPDAKKPEDWNEDAPKRIVDPNAKKPEGWLDDAPANIGDPSAKMPVDWDVEEDGEWEAPQIANPKCTEIGCGEWKAPMIDNPDYKGKWEPPMIRNPAYKGVWAPKRITNPDYFEDYDPFKMTSVAAIGFELWSMTGDILFDNIIITDTQSVLDKWTADTWDLKYGKEFETVSGGGGGIVDTLIDATKERPWLWFIYVCVVFLPFILILAFCLPGKKDKDAERKKTDEATPDDDQEKETKEEEVEAGANASEEVAAEGENAKVDDEAEAEDDKAKEESDEEGKDESEEEANESSAKEEKVQEEKVQENKDDVADEPPEDSSPVTRAMRRKTRKDT